MRSNSRINEKKRQLRDMLALTLLVAIMLSILFLTVIALVYKNSEESAYESLYTETREIQAEISSQVKADSEMLRVLAELAANLHSSGKSYQLVFESFSSVGLIEHIGILTPTNMILTKNANVVSPKWLRFEEERDRGEYISGRVEDATNPDLKIVRIAVPVVDEGHTVAMLYGTINLRKFEERYQENIDSENTYLFVIESGSGDFILDTQNNDVDNLTSLADRKYNDDYNYEQLEHDIKNGNGGYSSYYSRIAGQDLYVRYSPIGISDWCVMLAKPEADVFKEVNQITLYLVLLFVSAIVIMSIYIAIVLFLERRIATINMYSAKIRKRLLGINQNNDKIFSALKSITLCTRSRSSFFIDSDGEDYNYLLPSVKARLFSEKDRAYFKQCLMAYAPEQDPELTAQLSIIKLSVNAKLKEEQPRLYNILVDHRVSNIYFAAISSRDGSTSILGLINTKSEYYSVHLLTDIVICFSMAIYNKKHLEKTESSAVTDSLTGLYNRVAYTKNLNTYNAAAMRNISCVYIDVNELHNINNRLGHAVGDQLLLVVSSAIKEFFNGADIYRLGGDEFLVFVTGKPEEQVSHDCEAFLERLASHGHYVSLGHAYAEHVKDISALVKTAEQRMYYDKAEYYQSKNAPTVQRKYDETDVLETGSVHVDSALKIMSTRFLAVFSVNLDEDRAKAISLPTYLREYDTDGNFKAAFTSFIENYVEPDYHRPLLNFLEFNVLRNQLSEGNFPSTAFETSDNIRCRLTIYPSLGDQDYIDTTVWTIEKEED